MERHQPVALFPEGTTGHGHGLLPFKPALFAVLLPPPRAIRVQPVLIDYGAATNDIAWTNEEPGGANAARVLARRGTVPVTLHFLDPFDPGEHPNRKAIAMEARARIAAAQGLGGYIPESLSR
jgi:1-acyl-sn-glycerol-3-phosphate acyltransferase